MLASLDDIRTHLPRDKFAVNDGNAEINLFQIDVQRLIKGYLSGVFSVSTLAVWASPTTTPADIRACAGRLIAAFYYAKRTSEDLPDWDRTYPQRLYDEAMRTLQMIRDGDIVLDPTIVTEVPGTQFDELFFYPDATARAAAFTMEMRW